MPRNKPNLADAAEDFVADEPRREVEQLRALLSIERQRAKALDKERIAADRIVEYAKIALRSLPTVRPPAPLPASKRKGKTRESAVLLASCWHIGETVRAEEMGGLNAYDFDVFCARLQHVIDTTVKFCLDNMVGYEFDELHVIHTGDAVSGIIHDELIESNCLNIVEQAHLGALVTAQALRELCAVFPKVVFTGVVGNHGRTEKAKRWKGKAQVNWDYVFYNYLATMLRDQPNITFNVPLSFWAGIEIRGYNFHISHGDTAKSWNGIPFYGLNREAGKWTEIAAVQSKVWHYFIRSHYHTSGNLQRPAGEMILNASLKGGDEYAMGLALFGAPIQTLFGVHERHGRTWQLSINAQNAAGPCRYKYDRTLSLAAQLEVA